MPTFGPRWCGRTVGLMLLGFAAIPTSLHSQSNQPPLVWPVHLDPSSLGSPELTGFGVAWLSLDHALGSLRQVQDPSRRHRMQLAMAGRQQRQHGFGYGRFSYARELEREVRWSAVADPHDPMPYLWADSSGGDWIRDEVRVGFAEGHATSRGWALGWGANARYVQGARRNDPRPLVRLRDLDATVGLRGKPHATPMGMMFTLGAVREENEIGYFAGDDPFVYRLRGPSTFDRTQLVRAERARTSWRLQGRAFVQRPVHDRWVELGMGGEIRRDTILQGVARPEGGGSLRHGALSGWVSLLAEGQESPAALSLSGAAATSNGTDPVFRAVNLTQTDWTVRLDRGGAGIFSPNAPQARPLDRSGFSLQPLHPADRPGEPHWGLQIEGQSVEDVAAGHKIHWLRGAGAVGTSRAFDTEWPVLPTRVSAAVGASVLLDAGWEVARPTLMTDRIARPDYDLARANLGYAHLEAVFTPGKRRSAEGRAPAVTLSWVGMRSWGTLADDPTPQATGRGRQRVSILLSLHP
jgi:hypothetical protein